MEPIELDAFIQLSRDVRNRWRHRKCSVLKILTKTEIWGRSYWKGIEEDYRRKKSPFPRLSSRKVFHHYRNVGGSRPAVKDWFSGFKTFSLGWDPARLIHNLHRNNKNKMCNPMSMRERKIIVASMGFNDETKFLGKNYPGGNILSRLHSREKNLYIWRPSR